MADDLPIMLILGPTAGGKTRLAIDLALRLPGGGECISADSMQVYRGMDIGTAKPDARERGPVPHHLLDLVDPGEDGFTVDTWLALAEESITAIRGRGRWPIVVGGTNLYVQALLAGLADGPEPDPTLRARLEATPDGELRSWLERLDPAAASRIHANDRKRSVRAIEVCELTGRRISDLQQEWNGGHARTDIRLIGLEWPADAINRRINRRVAAMIEAGLVEEARGLWTHGLGRQAREALGYRQLIDLFEGRSTLDEAVEQIKIRTRRCAKHQRTWLRRFRSLPGTLWLPAGEIGHQGLVNKSLTFAREEREGGPRQPAGTLDAPDQAANSSAGEFLTAAPRPVQYRPMFSR